jgi:hypothetical protein
MSRSQAAVAEIGPNHSTVTKIQMIFTVVWNSRMLLHTVSAIGVSRIPPG